MTEPAFLRVREFTAPFSSNHSKAREPFEGRPDIQSGTLQVSGIPPVKELS